LSQAEDVEEQMAKFELKRRPGRIGDRDQIIKHNFKVKTKDYGGRLYFGVVGNAHHVLKTMFPKPEAYDVFAS
jgi:hypothetical protein